MRGVLFLCVSNSARNQMAEGIARSIAPPSVKLWSAGSQPWSASLEAMALIQELGTVGKECPKANFRAGRCIGF
jgi:protein-tyrosine-phosphatase